MDIMPTVLELLNHSADALQSDGKSLLPVLFNTSVESQHEYIFHYVEVTKPSAITAGSYKVVYTDIKGNNKEIKLVVSHPKLMKLVIFVYIDKHTWVLMFYTFW